MRIRTISSKLNRALKISRKDINPKDYAALILPGGRAPEYLRYDKDLIKVVKAFFKENKPVASICHGIEILATSDVLKGKKVTTIPKCRFDAMACGGVSPRPTQCAG